jgi:hypothetical protein
MNSINPPNTPLIDQYGKVRPEWYRFFNQLNLGASVAVSGEVQTGVGSGLEGGGLIQNGVDLSISDNGVTNPMIRESLPCSVVGRFQNSTGDVADIQAVFNATVLTRQGDILAFTPELDAIAIGTVTAAPSVRTDAFELTTAASASTATVTHSVPIDCDGTTYYILLSNVP